MREQLRAAQALLPDGQPVLVNHNPGKQESVAALEFFTSAGCPAQFIDYILHVEPGENQGNLKDFFPSKQNIYKQDPNRLNKTLRRRLVKVYSLANGSLDHIYDHGFNRHDSRHIDIVTKRVLELLGSANASKDTLRRAVIAAMGHDLGNILSRKLHSLVSPILLKNVLQQIQSDPKQWRTIRRAIQLHNEPVASWLIASWGEITEQERIANMRTTFGPEALALILADKTDVGRHRISLKATNREAVDADQHLEVNLLGETAALRLSEDGSNLDWLVSFTPGMSHDEVDELPSFVRQSKRRQSPTATVSERTHKLHSEHQIPHFFTWYSLFWQLYYERIVLAVRSAFALYSNLQTFTIRATDADSDGSTQLQFVFNRETLTNQFAHLEMLYVKRESRKK